MRAFLISLGALAMAVNVAPMRAADTPVPTFYKDVLPILQKNCQSCHRPGEVAPMSLCRTRRRVRGRARSTRTTAKQMPPWFADPEFGVFSNDRS